MIDTRLTSDEVRKIIRSVILNTLKEYGLVGKRLILFGSRARGEERRSSDWDVLVIAEGKLDRKTAREIKAIVRMELARYRIPIDILLQTSDEIERRKNDVGYLAYYVLKEGVDL